MSPKTTESVVSDYSTRLSTFLDALNRAATLAPNRGLHVYSDGLAAPKFPSALYAPNLHLVFRSLVGQIRWFWAAIAAGFVSATYPLKDSASKHLRRDLKHLYQLFEEPYILTDIGASGMDFLGLANIHTVESLSGIQALSLERRSGRRAVQEYDIACFCISSGSTGRAKGIPVQHRKMLEACTRLNEHLRNGTRNVFLNTVLQISMVVSLVMFEIPALLYLADQVVIDNHELQKNAVAVIGLVDKHRVSNMFGVSTMLQYIPKSIDTDRGYLEGSINLSCLTNIISSGEPILSGLVDKLGRKLHQLGPPMNVIMPTFGMTELCGSLTLSNVSPRYEMTRNYHFACARKPMRGPTLRVVNVDGHHVAATEPGNLDIIYILLAFAKLVVQMLVFSYRKPDLSPADFKAHHETSHVPLLQSLTGDHFPLSHTRHYIDRPANDSSATVLVGTQADFEYDAFGELTFANSGGFQTFVGIVGQAEAAEKIAADEEKF